MYHISQRFRSATLRHCFTCPLCVRAWNSHAPSLSVLESVSSDHQEVIGPFFSLSPLLHQSNLSCSDQCSCLPRSSFFQTTIFFQLVAVFFSFLIFCMFNHACWRLGQSWLKNLLITLYVSLPMTLFDSKLHVVILLEFQFT